MPSVKVGVTFYSGHDAPASGVYYEAASFDGLVDVLRKAHKYTDDKQAAPLFGAGPVFKNYRDNNNADVLTVAVVDIDKVSKETFVSKVKSLRDRGIEFYAYSTFSDRMHEGGPVCMRIVLPMSRPVTRTPAEQTRARALGYPKSAKAPFDEQQRFWAGLFAFFEGGIDVSAKDPSRQYYTPTSRIGATKTDLYYRGNPLDVDAVLALSGSPQALDFEEDPPCEFGVFELKALIKKLDKKGDQRAISGLRAALGCAAPGEKIAAAPYAPEDEGVGHHIRLAMSRAIANEHPTLVIDRQALAYLFMPTFVMREAKYGFRADEGFADFLKALIHDVAEARSQVRAVKQQARDKVREYNEMAYSFVGMKRDKPLEPHEVEALAEEAGGLEKLERSWIVQYGGSFYVRVGNMWCERPFTESELQSQGAVLLAPAATAGVVPVRKTLQGDEAALTAKELASKYGRVAKRVIGSLCDSRTFFDFEQETFVKSYCKFPDIEPRRSDLVEEFLHVSYGEQARLVTTWCMFGRDNRFASGALHVWGASRTGKNLLVAAQARMYGNEGATDQKSAFHKFNAQLLENPLIHADEKLHQELRDTGTFRQVVSALKQTIEGKGFPLITVLGAIRLLITTNRPDLFKGREDLTADDAIAVGSRFIKVHIREEARAWLEERESWVTKRLVEGREFAQHMLWHRSQVRDEDLPLYVKSGLLGGIDIASAKNTALEITTRSPTNSLVLLWVVRSLAKTKQALRIADQSLWVSPQEMLSQWDGAMLDMPRPDPHAVHVALQSMSRGVPMRSFSGIECCKVDMDYLETFARDTAQIPVTKLRALITSDLSNKTSGEDEKEGKLLWLPPKAEGV